jgi:hypothetical protein
MRYRYCMLLRKHRHDFYLLRVGYGGLMGALSNITEEGFALVHSTLFFDFMY